MKRLFALCAIIYLSSYVIADIRTNGVALATVDANAIGIGWTGDTWHPTVWTGSGSGGNFNGGRVYTTQNDVATAGCGGNLGFLEIVTLDFATPSNTVINCVNTMANYGNSGSVNIPAGWTDGLTWKSFNPFSYNGNIYWPIYRQQQSSPYGGSQSTIIFTSDRGVHFCNPATFAANSNTCPSNSTTAAGDPPPDASTGMMFGAAGNFANVVARQIHVQFCQDETCTGMPFSADSFLYFVSVSGAFTPFYASCVAKSSVSIMDKTQWWFWKGGNGVCGDTNSWTHTEASAVPIQYQANTGVGQIGYPSGIIYVNGQFLMTSYDGDGSGGRTTIFATAQYPWGPYKRFFTGGPDMGFVSTNLAWLDSSCSGCNTNPGSYKLGVMGTGYAHSVAGSPYFYQFKMANGGPSTPYTDPAGRNRIGRTNLQGSISGNGGTLITRGLTMATAYDDTYDYPSGHYTSAGMYFADILGSTRCFVAGSNPTGPVTWGNQGGTGAISYNGAGIYLPFQYANQLSNVDANCAGAVPLSGDAAFTVQMVVKPDNVTINGGVLFEFYDPAFAGARPAKDIYLAVNGAFQGGTHIDTADYGSGYLTSSPSWTNGNWYLVTYTKAPGILSATTAKLYIGTTNFAFSQVNSADGAPPDLSPSMKARLGCWGFASLNYCNPGQSGETGLPAAHAWFALYNRVLSADEINRNYVALKAAFAKAPRSITIQ